jgi:PAS domain S-box-containing protein
MPMSADLHLLISALDLLEEGVLVTGPAEDDTPILYANAAFERLTGYSRSELVGRNCRILQGERTDPAVREQIGAAVRAGMPFEGDVLNYRRDGTPFLNRLRIRPVRGVPGEVTHFVGVQVDLTAAHAELVRSEERYRLLIEHAPYGIFALDSAGTFTEINRAGQEILRRGAAELVGRSFREVVAADDAAAAGETFARVLAGSGDETELAVGIVRPDGEHRSLEIILTVFDGLGERLLYGIARDVTELKARDLHLRRVERLASLGTLIAGVAHELNNPLTAVRGFAQLLMMDSRPDEDREALQLIRREADRMAKIVSDLRLVARESQERTAYGKVDVNDVVRHVLRVREYHLRTHNVVTETSLEADLPPVLGSRPDLEQVVLNLVMNAEQAFSDAAEDRVLSVRSYRASGRICVEVGDNGPGIAAEHLDRIFDPFFTTKAPGEGTGLGLSLVQRIVDEHGGQIAVQSVAGLGTTFEVRLPLMPEHVAAAPPPPSTRPAGAPVRSLRVLVVDDEEAIRRGVARFLQRRGHEVAQAAEGGEALRLIDGSDFDVVLSDLRMAGLDGLELLRRLREWRPEMVRRVIFFTGDPAGAAAVEVQSSHGARVLMKPLDFSALAAAVEECEAGAGPEALAAIGVVLLEQVGRIRDAFVARMRAHPAFAAAAGTAEADLEDQVCALLTDLSHALAVRGSAGADTEGLLRDNARRIELSARLHGRQRARLGWTAAMLRAESVMLGEEIRDALAAAAPPHLRARVPDAMQILDARLERVREASLEAHASPQAPENSEAE